MPWNRILLQKQIVTQLVRKFPAFNGSLPNSKERAIGPYLEPENPVHTLPLCLLKIQISDQLHAPVALPQAKEPKAPIREEAGWVSKPFWMRCQKKSLSLTEVEPRPFSP
jgi:hypothetical protein